MKQQERIKRNDTRFTFLIKEGHESAELYLQSALSKVECVLELAGFTRVENEYKWQGNLAIALDVDRGEYILENTDDEAVHYVHNHQDLKRSIQFIYKVAIENKIANVA